VFLKVRRTSNSLPVLSLSARNAIENAKHSHYKNMPLYESDFQPSKVNQDHFLLMDRSQIFLTVVTRYYLSSQILMLLRNKKATQTNQVDKNVDLQCRTDKECWVLTRTIGRQHSMTFIILSTRMKAVHCLCNAAPMLRKRVHHHRTRSSTSE
jgi:hypothetical protein